MKKIFRIFGEWIEGKLRKLCGKIRPEKRLVVVLAMFVLFSFGSLYMVTHAIYSIGKRDADLIQIEHIKLLELRHQNDSLKILEFQQSPDCEEENELKTNDYERE